jgi:hypothetical protein
VRAAPIIALVGAGLAAAPPAYANGGSARGAPLADIVAAAVVAVLLAALVLGLAAAHRAGRISFLGRLADFSSRVAGVPGWAALPAAITGGALVVAVFGFYWDVATHVRSPVRDSSHRASRFSCARGPTYDASVHRFARPSYGGGGVRTRLSMNARREGTGPESRTSARSASFCTLPSEVRGSRSRNTTSRGCL